ncbi:hypothetical protein [Costertonia aggregata]|uniref:Uncharacterized protein n=1 Tax=Costertonia aggregata TaxID=343403 RepID=A0A7H9ARL2_9FLAO|nr:hypothetical protein [Costertonia aggregata]QLG46059.1 hypothetical protein HYG79_12120 [Costertonia aggregata]
MALLTSGKRYGCKDSNGGIKKIYLAAFVPYSRNLFGFDGVLLTSIPTTFVYAFEMIGDNNSFQQSYDGIGYSQTLNVEFKRQDVDTAIQMQSLNYIELRALILDKNDNYLVFGLDNGLTSDSLEILTGNSRSEFNGYRMIFTGKEKHTSPFVLDPFNNGFIEVDEEDDFYQFQNLEAFMFQNGEQYYFN